ncbi:nuclear factor interleukin-3-regulated protein-like [Portunus trituberculatus]|uniref:nuclear factor interleukin-3-regulated protein-like n=1 Tax=Portunus trituberculatus TaxID=210409 RepID=UPI001E1CE1D4|nr:nuclear factor interleukin-3-regulated protein-like [Portunus trituberculatus]
MGEISITEDMEGSNEPLSGPEVQCEVSVAQPVMTEDGATQERLSPECSGAVPFDSTLAPPRDLKRSCSVILSSSLPSKSPTEWPRGGVLVPRRRVKSSCDTDPPSNLLSSPTSMPHPEHSAPLFPHRPHNPRLRDIFAPPLSHVPQDLSRKRPASDYPIELQVHLRQQVGVEGAGGRMEWVEMRCREGKRPNRAGERVRMKDGGEGRNKGGKSVDKIKEELEEEYANPARPSDVLQHRIMVAETVKSCPVNYPALIPLTPPVTGLGGYNSPSLLHSSYPASQLMDQKPSQQQGQNTSMTGPQDTPVGLGAPGLNLPSTLEIAALRKKDMFTQRKQREFIPDSKKDESYWDRRRRNNEAAKRSREKRRFNDMILEQRVIELSKENHVLKAQLTAIKDKYGILGESLVNLDQVLSSMPQSDQILAVNKRTKFSQALLALGSPPSVTSLLSPSGESKKSSGGSVCESPYPHDEPTSPQSYAHYPSHGASQMDDFHDQSSYGTSPPAHHQQYPPASTSDLYYNSSSALNLSAHPTSASPPTSHSPPSPAVSRMDYSPSDPELCRRSPECGMSLPHKLRHKSHLGDKDAAAHSLLALQAIKSEPNDHQQDPAEDSVGSSDERDSGISYSSTSSSCSDYHRPSENPSGSPSGCTIIDSSSYRSHQHQHHHIQHQQRQHHQQQQHMSAYPPQQQQQQQHALDGESSSEYENTHLKSELERLATEVASLKYMLVHRPRSETDSDGSR